MAIAFFWLRLTTNGDKCRKCTFLYQYSISYPENFRVVGIKAQKQDKIILLMLSHYGTRTSRIEYLHFLYYILIIGVLKLKYDNILIYSYWQYNFITTC